MLVRKYEMPWRRAYESYAGVAWIIALGFSIYAALTMDPPPWAFTACLIVICMVMALRRWGQALRLLAVRASLCGKAMQVIPTKRLRKLCRNPKEVFLGFGFEWQPVHSQRL